MEITTMKKKKAMILYEILVALLALVAVILAILDLSGQIVIESNKSLHLLDMIILIIFSIDYFTRLLFTKDKKRFFKKNIFDLIAIIPFNSLFRVLRMARLFRLVRLTRLIKLTRFVRLVAFGRRLKIKIDKFIHTNGFIYILYLTIITIFLGAIGIYYVEQNYTIKTFGDAVWWSFVTATTVGYGDISPATGFGRIIASVLMIVGIGFIGMLTGTIATYFLHKKEDNIENIPSRTINLDGLDENEIKEVLDFIDFIKSKK